MSAVSSDVPVLWLCGPPGVGKTAVAWEAYTRLVEAGGRVAYLDVDQLGMCYPERTGDPARHRLKARTVAALRANFAAAGATCLIVSGVVDAARGPEIDLIGDGVLVGRLRVDREELVARLHSRGGSFAVPEAAVNEADALDRSTFADWCLDTTGLSIAEVAERVLDAGRPVVREGVFGDTSAFTFTARPVDERSEAGAKALWLAGPTGVGKSTVGFRVFVRMLSAGVAASFVDVDQLGFFGTSRNHALRAKNLASVWANQRSAGASVLVVVGPVETTTEMELYEHALPSVAFTWCRLHTSPPELTRRVLSRRDGGSWAQPGDPLRGRPLQQLREVADLAVDEAEVLDARQLGLRVNVDELPPDEAAELVLERAAWPDGTTATAPG